MSLSCLLSPHSVLCPHCLTITEKNWAYVFLALQQIVISSAGGRDRLKIRMTYCLWRWSLNWSDLLRGREGFTNSRGTEMRQWDLLASAIVQKMECITLQLTHTHIHTLVCNLFRVILTGRLWDVRTAHYRVALPNAVGVLWLRHGSQMFLTMSLRGAYPSGFSTQLGGQLDLMLGLSLRHL